MKILRSALKHGCSPADIAHAISSAWQRTRVGADPDKWLYIGVDGAARPLEIVTAQGDDGAEVVIHAMKLRTKYYPEAGRRTLMSFEITDRVPGLSTEKVAAMAEQAEAGYDLADQASEPNPHFQRLQLVPADLLDAIDERAQTEGQSPDAVVRQALATYLHTA